MSVQTSYNYSTPKGVAGSLFDLAPYSIDSRINGEATVGALKFGMGAVQGSTPGSDVKIPTNSATADVFEGVVMTGFNTQMNMDGVVEILPSQTVGILRYGKAWVRIKNDVTVAYGDPLYLIISGANAGLFTASSDSGETKIAIAGRYIGAKGSGNVAPIELYNQMQTASAGGGSSSPASVALKDLTDVDLSTPATDGQVLKYNGTDSKWKAGDDSTGA